MLFQCNWRWTLKYTLTAPDHLCVHATSALTHRHTEAHTATHSSVSKWIVVFLLMLFVFIVDRLKACFVRRHSLILLLLFPFFDGIRAECQCSHVFFSLLLSLYLSISNSINYQIMNYLSREFFVIAFQNSLAHRQEKISAAQLLFPNYWLIIPFFTFVRGFWF